MWKVKEGCWRAVSERHNDDMDIHAMFTHIYAIILYSVLGLWFVFSFRGDAVYIFIKKSQLQKQELIRIYCMCCIELPL